jgi:hypothetical protein
MLGVPPAGYMPPGYAYIIPPQYQVPGNYQPGYPMPYAGPVEDIPAA